MTELAGMKQRTKMVEEFFQPFEIKRRETDMNATHFDNVMISYLEKNLRFGLVQEIMRTNPVSEGYEAWKRQALHLDTADQQIMDV